MRKTAVLLGMAAFLVAAEAAAEVPGLMTYSGILFTEKECCGYSYQGPVTFRLFTQEIEGDAIWEETHDAVTVEQGYVAVDLGAVTPLQPSMLAGELWLEVELRGIGPLVPRLRLTSVPFALHAGDADTLSGQGPDDFAAAGHDHDDQYVKLGEAPAGDVTGVVAGAGLVGGGDSGEVLLGLDLETVYEWAAEACYDTPDELFAALFGQYAPQGHNHDEAYVNEGQPGSVTAEMLANGAVTESKLGIACAPGDFLRMGETSWECADADALSDLVCAPGQVAQYTGVTWACADLPAAPAPPKCDAPGAVLQFDGQKFLCVTGGQLVLDAWGYLWDTDEHYAVAWAAADLACKKRGGRLPTITELFRVSAAATGQVGTPYAVNYQWSLTAWAANAYGVVRLTDGSVTSAPAANAVPYRCVFPNNKADAFAGNHCYGPPGEECYPNATEGKRHHADKYDRPAVSYVAAVDECNFYHAHVATAAEFAELIAGAPGLPSGSNNWLWAADSSRYDYIEVVKWKDLDLAFNATANTYESWAAKNGGPYRFRCVGVNFASGPNPNPIQGEFLAVKTALKGETGDRAKASLGPAISACFDAGGHVPTDREWTELIRAGLPNGPATWEWTSDATSYLYQEVITWTGMDLAFADFYPNYCTWVDRIATNQYPFRCAYYPLDTQYGGPADGKCFAAAPCYVSQKGGATKATVWVDATDRASANFITAVQTCRFEGGHLASFRDLFELSRDGMSGSGSWLWTSDAVGDAGANVMVAKWSGVDKAFSGIYGTYASYSDKGPAVLRPYRCIWTNELR